MTLNDFISKYSGKGLDYDGAYGFQCMDVYRQYVKEVLGAKQSPPVKGAKDVWGTYLPEVFTRTSNKPDNSPKPGDVVIWGTELGEFGHIAICVEGDNNSFTSFDQNYPIGSVCHLQKHTYVGVLGWLHPKGSTAPEPIVEDPDKVKVDLGKDFGVMEVQAIRSTILDLKQSVVDLQVTKAGLDSQVSAMKDGRRRLAEKLGCSDDFAEIEKEVAKLIHIEDHQNEVSRNPLDQILSALLNLLKRK